MSSSGGLLSYAVVEAGATEAARRAVDSRATARGARLDRFVANLERFRRGEPLEVIDKMLGY